MFYGSFCVSPAVHADNAIAEYKSIQQRLRSARTNHDWSASLTSANDLSQRLNGAPNSLLELARAKLHTNDFAGAVRDLQRFARMGQSTVVLAASPEFAPLRRQPGFKSITTAMKENRTPISVGTAALRISDPALLTEDLDYDPNTKRFFITTVRGKKIISADFSGTITEFAKSPDKRY